jgi:hypothetical protein
MVFAAFNPVRRKLQFGGPDLRARNFGASHLHGRVDGGEVLSHQSGFLSPGPDVFYAERLARDQGQSQGRPQHLPAAFSIRSVYMYE